MDILYTLNIINSNLKRIFKERYLIDIDNLGNDMLDKNLLGQDIGMTSTDMLCLFFDIEKEFNILIPEEDIAMGRFNSFNNIVGIITKQLKLK